MLPEAKKKMLLDTLVYIKEMYDFWKKNVVKRKLKKKKTSCYFILLQTLSSKFGKKNSLFPPFFLGVETGKSSLGSRLELMEKNGDYLVTNGDLGLMGFPS